MIAALGDIAGTPAAVMDALSDVLRVTQLTGGVFFDARFSAPWCIAARMEAGLCAPFLGPSTHLIPYHYVVSGELLVALENRDAVPLRQGEMVLFPNNDLHFMGSDLSRPPTSARDLLSGVEGVGPFKIRHGGGGDPSTRLICGYLGCLSTRANPVFSALPPSMKISAEQSRESMWFRSLFEYAANEMPAGETGAATVLAKVSELLFVEAVRRYAQELPSGCTGWLAGLQDPVVSRALTLLHRQITRNWSVEDLGREVGLSRSALADRFASIIGVPPMQYLAQWRMQVAALTLRSTSLSLARVAERVGYESEAAFSRAFKKAFDTAPATWRRHNT
jgi:AraC-like DNA-binding protein